MALPTVEDAIARRAAGDNDRARQILQEIVVQQPGNALAHNVLGALCIDANDYTEAKTHFLAALNADHRCEPALINFRIASVELKALNDALTVFKQICQLVPDYGPGYRELGFIYVETGQQVEALEALREALKRLPRDPLVLCLMGETLVGQERFEEAERCYEASLAADPQSIRVRGSFAVALSLQGKSASAYRHLNYALRLQPDNADILTNIGVCYERDGDYEAALPYFRKAIDLGRDSVLRGLNLGNVYFKLARFDEACEAYEAVIRRDEEEAGAHTMLALVKLLQRDYESGFYHYEWRRRFTTWKSLSPSSSAPEWTGEPLASKSLLIYAEQGMGDTIQFSRAVGALARHGARVHVLAQEQLRPLVETLTDLASFVGPDDALPAHDYQVPLLSVLGLVGWDEIRTSPVSVRVDPGRRERWRSELRDSQGKKIGLVWAGSPGNARDRERSVAFGKFKEILKVPNCNFVSLQVGLNAADISEFGCADVIYNPCDELKDYGDTAALIEQLDLVITVDTSVAHLAGVLGKPVWVLLAYVPDWRWGMTGETSDWYASAKLFRQASDCRWEPVLTRLRSELSVFVGEGVDEKTSKDPASATLETSVPAHARNEATWREWLNYGVVSVDMRKLSAALCSVIPVGARVVDLGCGQMILEPLLPSQCHYQPVDVVRRDARTLVSDLTNGVIPPLVEPSHIALAGFVALLDDPNSLLRSVHSLGLPTLIAVPTGPQVYDRDWQQLIQGAGFSIQKEVAFDESCKVFVLSTELCQPVQTKTVVTLHDERPGSMGYALRQNLFSRLIPNHAVLDEVSIRDNQSMEKLLTTPSIDLVVLGLGGSFGPGAFNDRLLELLSSKLPSVGIFGLTHPMEMGDELMPVLEGLNLWFTRNQSEALLYGHANQKVRHWGDLLVGMLPMRSAQQTGWFRASAPWLFTSHDANPLNVLQSFENVWSDCLDALACALLSARLLAYSENRELDNIRASGAATAMLMDVFFESYAENQAFTVDREAVLRYRVDMQRRTTMLQQSIENILL